MQLKITIIFSYFCIIFYVPHAASQNLAFSSNARTFETQSSALLAKSLAHACLSIFTSDGLPCSPTLSYLNKKPELRVQGLISNGHSTIKNVTQLLDNNITESLLNDIFTTNNVIQLETNAELSFLSPSFNAKYTPFNLKSLAVIRNESNPDVEMYAVQESGFTAQGSHLFNKNLSLGAQIRLLDRKFIRQRFRLVELGTEEGKNILKPKKQKVTYIEPAATYTFNTKWQPRATIMIANLGFYSEKYDELETPVDVQVGLRVSPPIKWGQLEMALEYRSMNYNENPLEKLHLGVLYSLGAMNLAGGIDSFGISGGIYYSLEKINAGILYSTTRLINNDDYYTQTVYVQLGWQI